MCVISTSDIFSELHTRCDAMNIDHVQNLVRKRYIGEFEIDPRELKLWSLAKEYHQITEDYDKKVCTGVCPYDGSAMPNGPYEFQYINRHAQQVLKSILMKGQREGFTKLELCTRQISQNPYPIRILPS